jgi:NAD(P)H-flavin reductase
MPTWYAAELIGIEEVAPDVRLFTIRVPELSVFDFRPGQFVTFDLPIGEKRLDRWRSYSIASIPAQNNELTLCIGHLPGGRAGKYWFEDCAIGQSLKMKGPDGQFFLPSFDKEDALVMICTGTGIVPFRSMIQSLIQSGEHPKKLHLIFGTRYRTGILYKAEMEALAERYDWFSYDVCLSREPDFEGQKGHVHQVYVSAYSQTSLEKTRFMLCGWQAMIDEAQSKLKEMGVAPSNILFELYG